MFDHPQNVPLSDDLDTPINASFNGAWSEFTQTYGTATALREDIGHFAKPGGRSQRDYNDFVTLIKSRTKPAILFQIEKPVVPKGLEILAARRCVQMVSEVPIHAGTRIACLDLDTKDRDDMFALADLTKPGPFERNTHLLGGFIGLRKQGQLVAMAGRRMAFPGWIEISGVCVHPDFRGRSLARLLVAEVMRRIAQEGATPFLHTYSDNEAAIMLYRRLGFEIRTEAHVMMVS